MSKKVKLTLSISKSIIDKAKETATKKHIPLSRLIENFLSFFNEPYAYCFKCGRKFIMREASTCPICGWLKCIECRACRCGLSDDAAMVAFYMRRVCEDLLIER